MVSYRPHPTHWFRRHPKASPVALAGLLAGAAWYGVARVVVTGPSMAPRLVEGDRLLVLRTGARRLQAGHMVAVRDPRDESRVLVKRVSVVRRGDVEVLGDNPAASTDSRTFGPVANRLVLGRVVYRYHPPTRTGWLR